MNSFLSNSYYRITFAANNVETANLISQLIGNKTATQHSHNKPKFMDLDPAARTINTSEVQRALLLPQEVPVAVTVAVAVQVVQFGNPDKLFITKVSPALSDTRIGKVPGGVTVVVVPKEDHDVTFTAQPGGTEQGGQGKPEHALQS